MSWRKRESHISKDPVKRKKQLENLLLSKKRPKTAIKLGKIIPLPDDPVYKNNIVKYLEEQYYLPETKAPIILEDWQKKEILDPLFNTKTEDSLRRYSLALLSTPKKNGKSCLAAGIANYFLFQEEDDGEIILAANDKEQASWIIYSKLIKSLRMNKEQYKKVRIGKDFIENKRTDTVVRVVAQNLTTSGLNPNLTIFDELWAFELETSRKFFEELTTVPTRKEPLILIVSYAGYDEVSLLHELYTKGLKSDDDSFFFYWINENKASWITEKYLKKQKGRLRPSTYLRLHENRWTSSSEIFINDEIYQSCVDPFLSREPEGKKRIYIGVDIGISGDCSALAAVYREEEEVLLADHRIFIPGEEKIDLEDTVERVILEWNDKYTIEELSYDPYQFHRSAKTLAKKGIPISEFPQSQGNCVRFSQNLFDLLKARKLRLYSNPNIREHLLNCYAVQTPRGWRIVKRKKARKIDFSVALALACLSAVEGEGQEPYTLEDIENMVNPGTDYQQNYGKW